jgi:uncharacterized phage infection (PIP) family protein YhgE
VIAQAQADLNNATAALTTVQTTLTQVEAIAQQTLDAAAADNLSGVVNLAGQLNDALNNMNTQLNNAGANLVKDLPPPVVLDQIQPPPAIPYESQ